MIRTDTTAPMAERLADLFIGLTQVIEESRPDVIAVESVFTNQNLQTAISVGRASGVALLAAAQAGLQVSEYAPTAVKSAITGDGSASKSQIQQMVARLLRLAEPPRPADAADALAIALCHLRAAPLERGPMIGRLRGVLVSRHGEVVCVEVGGVGYEVTMTPRGVSTLPGVGEEVVVHTHTHVARTR